MRVRTPRPEGGCHQCCTSPSMNCRGRAKQVFAGNGASRRIGHYVLKLVTETICAAQLIKGLPRPDTTSQRLVKQPTIHAEYPWPARAS